jgi:hypothetical protein
MIEKKRICLFFNNLSNMRSSWKREWWGFWARTGFGKARHCGRKKDIGFAKKAYIL